MTSDTDPLERFQALYHALQQHNLPEPAAVTLATASLAGKPSARTVLLKEFDERGFVFYTNLASHKARDLEANPQAALCFYWEPIYYQLRVEGRVELVSSEEADAYFATRPRGSQIGAWASRQSATLSNRAELEAGFQEYESRFAGKDVPRPDFWSGYRLVHDWMEFWERREDRLHERTLYTRTERGWQVSLLFP